MLIRITLRDPKPLQTTDGHLWESGRVVLAKLIGRGVLLKGHCPSKPTRKRTLSTAFLPLFLCREQHSTALATVHLSRPMMLGNDFSTCAVLVNLVSQRADRNPEQLCRGSAAPALVFQRFDNEFALDLRDRVPDEVKATEELLV